MVFLEAICILDLFALSAAISELVLASRKARTSLFCALSLTTLFELDSELASASELPPALIPETSDEESDLKNTNVDESRDSSKSTTDRPTSPKGQVSKENKIDDA